MTKHEINHDVTESGDVKKNIPQWLTKAALVGTLVVGGATMAACKGGDAGTTSGDNSGSAGVENEGSMPSQGIETTPPVEDPAETPATNNNDVLRGHTQEEYNSAQFSAEQVVYKLKLDGHTVTGVEIFPDDAPNGFAITGNRADNGEAFRRLSQ